MDYTDVIIREAKHCDCKPIHYILRASFQEIKERYTPKTFRATVVSALEVDERMREGPVWVACCKDEIFGTLSGKMTKNGFYLRGMAVHPEMRNQQIGYKLLLTAEAYALEHTCSSLHLRTTPYLTAAIRLYQKFGFQIINEPPYHLHHTPIFNMQKILKYD